MLNNDLGQKTAWVHARTHTCMHACISARWPVTNKTCFGTTSDYIGLPKYEGHEWAVVRWRYSVANWLCLIGFVGLLPEIEHSNTGSGQAGKRLSQTGQVAGNHCCEGDDEAG